MPLTEILAAIEASGVAQIVAIVPGVYPLVSALHIVGIALLVGPIVAVDLRLLRVFGSGMDAALPSLIRLALWGFALTVASGILLVSVQIGTYVGNPAFLIKLGFLVLAGVNAVGFRLMLGATGIDGQVGRAGGRAAASVSLTLWLGAILAGRWIAFL